MRWALKGEGPGYASPVVAELGGVRQLVTATQTRLVGVDPVKGGLLWALPFTTDYDQNAITPLVVGDLVVFSGVDKPLRAVRPVRKGSAWEATPVWEAADVALYMSSPIAVSGRLYRLLATQEGTARRPRSEDRTRGVGERRPPGRQRGARGHGRIRARADETAACSSCSTRPRAGMLRSRPTPWRTSPTWAHPVPVRGGFLVKDVDSLTLYGLE